ncbi:MAG: phosphopentomutase [Ahniella sp.]|nr:phosphopentomutase [Ahniella sp.]
MSRALLIVLDSLGIGAAPDAPRFGDEGADTLGHIRAHCASGQADVQRSGPLRIPNLDRLGLHYAWSRAHGQPVKDLGPGDSTCAVLRERSTGKDTTSGHWELCGCPVDYDWGYFSAWQDSMPQSLLDAWCERASLPGVLGNCRGSGTELIKQLGEEHIRTGKPIVYTSADSVLQIAAHEQHFGLQRLDEVCHITRELVDAWRIARVISRPFVGDSASTFRRTGNRHDLAVPPHAPTLLDAMVATGFEVIGIGKISDIFAGHGISRSIPATGLPELFDVTRDTFRSAPDGSLVFVNFVDFDSEYGHRRDVPGYARALEYVDQRLPELLELLQDGDLLMLTADHGNDPSWTGSDHTRECVPLLAIGAGLRTGFAGIRESFADLGQTLARHFGLPALAHGQALPGANA